MVVGGSGGGRFAHLSTLVTSEMNLCFCPVVAGELVLDCPLILLGLVATTALT
jgi:hypothetical protein